ncbi:Aste57867_12738 [Aphanomyces stellatus]|uniref:Aste57867_12738 protein n=1 Tax=Aphanomyces stellatus TaxID=120398 RepID=A0A485KYD6_9STRA|nr:hypothetical protein As57867_012690 [Aphanomyces stellatus]VFT89588.1 Aste57867_12738 [Aphanomyces stellatus]
MKGLNLHGVTAFFHAVTRTPKLLVPHLSVKDLNEIPFAELRAMGFKGVVFDKDNTLTVPHATQVVSHVQDALVDSQRIFGHDHVVIFSNSAGSSDDLPNFAEAATVERELNVTVLRHGVKKPLGVDQMRSALNVNPHELIMVGDRYSTDVLFGNSNGMLTIRTDQLSTDGESALNLLMQVVEKTILRRLHAQGIAPPPHPLYNPATDN